MLTFKHSLLGVGSQIGLYFDDPYAPVTVFIDNTGLLVPTQTIYKTGRSSRILKGNDYIPAA